MSSNTIRRSAVTFPSTQHLGDMSTTTLIIIILLILLFFGGGGYYMRGRR